MAPEHLLPRLRERAGLCRGPMGPFLLRGTSPGLPGMSPMLEYGAAQQSPETGARTLFPFGEPGRVASPLCDSLPPAAKVGLYVSPSNVTVQTGKHRRSALSPAFSSGKWGQHFLPVRVVLLPGCCDPRRGLVLAARVR